MFGSGPGIRTPLHGLTVHRLHLACSTGIEFKAQLLATSQYNVFHFVVRRSVLSPSFTAGNQSSNEIIYRGLCLKLGGETGIRTLGPAFANRRFSKPLP